MMPELKLSKKNAIHAWHFCKGMKLRDGTPLVQGKVYHVADPIMCERGLHASVKPLDALDYAPGNTMCRVRCWGETIVGDDKLVSEYRVADTIIDAEQLLGFWACNIAEACLCVYDVTDQRSWDAIEIKRAWLCGNATDKELAAARAAARAAWAAARAAAGAELNASLEIFILENMGRVICHRSHQTD